MWLLLYGLTLLAGDVIAQAHKVIDSQRDLLALESGRNTNSQQRLEDPTYHHLPFGARLPGHRKRFLTYGFKEREGGLTIKGVRLRESSQPRFRNSKIQSTSIIENVKSRSENKTSKFSSKLCNNKHCNNEVTSQTILSSSPKASQESIKFNIKDNLNYLSNKLTLPELESDDRKGRALSGTPSAQFSRSASPNERISFSPKATQKKRKIITKVEDLPPGWWLPPDQKNKLTEKMEDIPKQEVSAKTDTMQLPQEQNNKLETTKRDIIERVEDLPEGWFLPPHKQKILASKKSQSPKVEMQEVSKQSDLVESDFFKTNIRSLTKEKVEKGKNSGFVSVMFKVDKGKPLSPLISQKLESNKVVDHTSDTLPTSFASSSNSYSPSHIKVPLTVSEYLPPAQEAEMPNQNKVHTPLIVSEYLPPPAETEIPTKVPESLPSQKEAYISHTISEYLPPPKEVKIPTKVSESLPSQKEVQILPTLSEYLPPAHEKESLPSQEEIYVPPKVFEYLPPPKEAEIPTKVSEFLPNQKELYIPPQVSEYLPPPKEVEIPTKVPESLPSQKEIYIPPKVSEYIPPKKDDSLNNIPKKKEYASVFPSTIPTYPVKHHSSYFKPISEIDDSAESISSYRPVKPIRKYRPPTPVSIVKEYLPPTSSYIKPYRRPVSNDFYGCLKNSDCLSREICKKGSCVHGCILLKDMCVGSARCKVRNHIPACSCPPMFTSITTSRDGIMRYDCMAMPMMQSSPVIYQSYRTRPRRRPPQFSCSIRRYQQSAPLRPFAPVYRKHFCPPVQLKINGNNSYIFIESVSTGSND